MFTEEKDFNKRVRQAITISWEILQQKIASGFLEINKEASLQLQFANIFHSLMGQAFGEMCIMYEGRLPD